MDPSEHGKGDLGKGASGGHGPTHADRGPPGGDGWLRSVLENSSEVVKVVDPDGTLRYASPAFGWILGHDPVEAVGTMNVLDHVHPDDLPRVLAESEKALAEGRTVSNKAEYRFRHADGSWRWVESVGTYLLDDPAVGGVVVTVRDITWRKEAEERLRLQAQLLEAVGEAVIALDADRRVVYWNRAAEEMYGVSSGEVLGQRLMDRVVPEDLRTHAEEIMAGVRAGLSWKGEFVVRRKDGTSLTVEATNTSVLGEDGEQVGVVGVLRDVTERKGAEEALRRSEAELFSVLESITDGFFLLDEEWRFAYVNPQAALMMDRTGEDLVGERLWEDDTFYPEYCRAVAEGKTVEFEGYYSPLKRWYGVRAYPSQSGLSVYFQDVTERKEAEERHRTLVERIPPIVYIERRREGETAAYDTTYISPRVEEILGYPPQRFTEDPDFWDRMIHPEDLGAVREEDERTDRTGEPFSMEYRAITSDGRTLWIRDEATLVRDEVGEPLYWLGVQTDVTERRMAEAKLQEAEARYRSLVERVPVAIYRQEIDHSGAISYISPQIEAITGYAPEEYADPTFWVRTMHPDDRRRVLDEDERTDRTGEPFRVEFRKATKDGRLIWLRDEAVLVRDAAGEPLYWQGAVSDITERKTLEGRLEHQALHDSLTGLPNRRLFVDRLGQALRRTSRRLNRTAAVLFMDLDDFKVVNDSLGHDVGDLLLSVLAQRLGRCLRTEDALARFGGDEFVVLIEDVDDPAEAVQVAERITEELRWPFRLEGRELFVAASIGISLGDARTHDPEGLLREADTAMYRAKEAGGGFTVFDPAMHERALGRLEFENDLRRAPERGEFVVHYQPIVSLVTGDVRALEALVRWEHPVRGLLNPDEFVPEAEESGLVVSMGVAVLEEACRRAKGWQEAHPQIPPLVMSVNLSARQLARPDLAEVVEGVLGRTGFEGSCLALDVTETVYVKALEGNTKALSRLRAIGVGVSIDDFGTGYASLSYLKRLPADALKIDKSFVQGLGYDIEDTAIVRMIVDLAHTLGMEVVAEGVETEEQVALLAELGCDFAQGYLFSKPMPPEGVPGFLAG